GAVVETNFGIASNSRIGELYSAIAEVQTALIDSSIGTAFAHFSRAFAVVMEESVRQLNKSRLEDTAATCTTTQSPAAVTTSPQQPALQPVRQLQQSQIRLQSHARVASSLAGTTPRGHTTPINKANPSKNFSEEARKGAVAVNHVLTTVRRSEMIQFLQKIGPLSELTFPIFNRNGKASPYAFAKYESDECATRAIEELNGADLNGGQVSVYRASYWVDHNPHRVFLNKKPEQLQPMQPVQQLQQL
ncbi:hypothetical protein PFISCL1PPCAC_21360, partial [Pristionchus fissidentatus]